MLVDYLRKIRKAKKIQKAKGNKSAKGNEKRKKMLPPTTNSFSVKSMNTEESKVSS